MKIFELVEESKEVMVFKGMHGDAFPGNQQCIRLAKQLNATVFEYTQRSDALRRIRELKPKKLVLIGYSAGVKTVIDISEQYTPALSILIAGYPTTLQAGENRIQGPYINYYQPKELDSILRSKKLPPYKPQGGEPMPVDQEHDKIVAAVTSDIIRKVKNI